VATVGIFDGVHLGHQALLERVTTTARQRKLTSVVVTFEPHPLQVLRPEVAPHPLCTPAEKVQLLQTAGVDRVAVLPFTRQLAALSPREFVEDVLLAHFGLVHLVVGYDHGFGKDRSGDAATLQSLGQELHYDVTVVPHTDLHAQPISSTRIRALISQGEILEAARALGRPYSINGRVVRGDGRGKELGFPTANLDVDRSEKLLPAEGIYAVHARLDPEDAVLPGLLHLGPRPTFEGAHASAEVFLLDFQGELYGRELCVYLCARLRPVEQFPNVQALVHAMHQDVAATRQLFQHGPHACQ
jgi:riboflavin kinase/FMN adenylyltransferase